MEIETVVKFLSDCLDMAKIENISCNDHHVKIMMHGRKNLNANKTLIKFERKPKMHVLTFSFTKKVVK